MPILLLKKISWVVLAYFWCHGASAKLFVNSFVSFELPAKWECVLTKNTWNCSNQFEKKEKSAVIVIAAKEAGPQDNLKQYTKEISSRPGVYLKNKKFLKSKKLQIKNTNINNHTWVDGLTFNSEAPNYYTRYLATVKNNIGILITFTSHKDQYTLYVQEFLRAIASLKVVTTKNTLSKKITPEVTGFNNSSNNHLPLSDEPDFQSQSKSKQLLSKTNIAILLFLLIGALVYVLKFS